MTGHEFPRETSMYPEASRAELVFGLGIVSLFFFQIVLGPIVWIMGTNEIRAIENGRRPPEGLEKAKSGKKLAMVATILSYVGLALILGLLFLPI